MCFLSCPSTRNKKVRSLFHMWWKRFAPNIQREKVWTLSSTYLITNKPRYICLKLFHRCFPIKYYLQTMKSHWLYQDTCLELSPYCFFQEFGWFYSKNILRNFDVIQICAFWWFFFYYFYNLELRQFRMIWLNVISIKVKLQTENQLSNITLMSCSGKWKPSSTLKL